uniref:Syntaxin binding protein 4 n=1 Tax=Salmo trutta TaxID=8032 RepID=A0A674F457_SALTR
MSLSLPSDSIIQLICISKGTGLGLIIKGGANRAEGPMVLIQEIVPGGDCQRDGRLQPGDQLVSINKESLIGVTYEEARSILTRTKLRWGSVCVVIFKGMALDALGLNPTEAQRQTLRARLQTDPAGTVAYAGKTTLPHNLEVKSGVEESRALRSRIQLSEAAQKQARGMEMDYEEVIHLLEAEIAELQTQRTEQPGQSSQVQELKKRVAVLECQLRKNEEAKKGFEVSMGKLLNFVEVQCVVKVYTPLAQSSHCAPLGAQVGKKSQWTAATLTAEAKELTRTVSAILEVEYLPYGWEEAYTAEGTQPNISALISVLHAVLAMLAVE